MTHRLELKHALQRVTVSALRAMACLSDVLQLFYTRMNLLSPTNKQPNDHEKMVKES